MEGFFMQSDLPHARQQSDLEEYDGLLSILPPVIARKDIERLLGGIISRGHLANLDYKGEGPPRIEVGRHVGYLRGPFVEWLKERYARRKPAKMPARSRNHALD